MTNNTIIFGIRTCIEAIKAGKTIEKVYIQKGLNGPLFNELNYLIRSENISNSYVPVEKLNKLSKFNNHQGIVARLSQIEYADLEEILVKITNNTPLFLLLDNITDVRNFGAIIRTAECCGVDAIVIPNQGSAPLNSEAIKTSAGAAFNVPICRVNHIKDAIYMLQASEIQIVAATEKTKNSVYKINFNKPTAVIMGSEHKGVSNAVLKLADVKANLPILGSIESLNVSVACGAFLYEVVRQRLDL